MAGGGGPVERVLALREREIFAFALWGFFALAAVASAILISAAAIESGGGARAPVAAVESGGNTDESARLRDTIDRLLADQERLVRRLAEFEQGQGDLTATIASDGKSATWRLPPFPYGLKLAKTPIPAPARESEAAAVPVRESEFALRAELMPETTESIVTRTEFALDLGGESSLDGLRARWAALRGNHGKALANLQPLVALRESDQPGAFDFRLVVGPIANAADAARTCASLNTTKIVCAITTFEGQHLALR
jgi:hypothetical protein